MLSLKFLKQSDNHKSNICIYVNLRDPHLWVVKERTGQMSMSTNIGPEDALTVNTVQFTQYKGLIISLS